MRIRVAVPYEWSALAPHVGSSQDLRDDLSFSFRLVVHVRPLLLSEALLRCGIKVAVQFVATKPVAKVQIVRND